MPPPSPFFPITHYTYYGATWANQLSAKLVKKLAPFNTVGLAVLVTLHLVLRSPAAATLFSTSATYSLIKQERPGPSWHEGTT